MTAAVAAIIAGAGEQRMKGEAVRCPVCRTLWPSASGMGGDGPNVMPVSVPVVMGGAVTSPASQHLSSEKQLLVETLKGVSVWRVVSHSSHYSEHYWMYVLLFQIATEHLVPQFLPIANYKLLNVCLSESVCT